MDARDVDEVGERASPGLAPELAEYAEGLVEGDQPGNKSDTFANAIAWKLSSRRRGEATAKRGPALPSSRENMSDTFSVTIMRGK